MLRPKIEADNKGKSDVMKIVFALSPFWHTEAPPIGIGYLNATMKKHGFETRCFDFNIELFREEPEEIMTGWDFHFPDLSRTDLFGKDLLETNPTMTAKIGEWSGRILDEDPDVVGLTTYYENFWVNLAIARTVKEKDPGKRIILGGPYCRRNRVFMELIEKFDFIDVVVVGEGEETLLEIMKGYEITGELGLCKGAIVGNRFGGTRSPIKDPDRLPFPDYDDFPLPDYTMTDRVYFLSSRGCVGRCAFCRDRNLWPGYACRSAENIFEEMKLRKERGYSFLRFSDLVVNGNLKVLDKLCDLVIEDNLDIEWDGAIKSRPGMDIDLLRKLKKANFRGGNFSVESGSQRVLDLMKKGHKTEVLEKNMKDMMEADIMPSINIIVGFPGETEETFQETLAFIERNKQYIHSLASLTPCNIPPESDLHDNYGKYGVTLDEESESRWTRGDNTYQWRLDKCKEVYNFTTSLGITTFCDQFKKDVRSSVDDAEEQEP